MGELEERHAGEVDRSQRLSNLVAQAVQEMPVDPTVSEEERATARAAGAELRETAEQFTDQQLAVLKALGLVAADGDRHQITPTMKQRAFEKCRDLFGNQNDPTQRDPRMPAPFNMPELKPDPDWTGSEK